MVQDVPVVFSLPRDKKDEPYLNLAIEVAARAILSLGTTATSRT
jgi:predicted nucleic acid-binding protein